MLRVAAPLRAMGAGVELAPGDLLPMTIRGGELKSIEWNSSVASAQVKSAILLAALCSGVPVVVREPALSRDHTELMLEQFGRDAGARLTRKDSSVSFVPPSELRAFELTIPGDPSAAAYFVALAALASRGELSIPGVALNPTRTGFMEIARRMGVNITIVDRDDSGPEPVGTLVVRPSSLVGVEVSAAEVPAALDELPLVAALASRAHGVTTIRGASELRVKECDRIAVMVSNLRTMGVDAEELEDGLVVRGGDHPLRGRAFTHGDHRIAMTFGVLSALPDSEITVDDPACVAVSFPQFWEALREAIG
jgi:3-phosphoshikimate 1-carboxyvinyltransferase